MLNEISVESRKTTVALPENKTSAKKLKLAVLIKNANTLMAHQEVGLALNMLRVASTWAGDNLVYLRFFAECLESSKNYREEIKVREYIVKLNATFDDLLKLARSYQGLNLNDQAMNTYYEALAVLKEEDDKLFEVYKNMGNLFVLSGDFESAEEFYNKAYIVNGQSDILFVNFGTLEVQRNDFNKACIAFRRAVELNPHNANAWTGLALTHNEVGDYDLAYGNLARALEIDPNHRTAIHLMACWSARDKRPQKAIPYVENYMHFAQEDTEMSIVLIQLFYQNQRFDLAFIESTRALAWDPTNGILLNLRSQLEEKM